MDKTKLYTDRATEKVHKVQYKENCNLPWWCSREAAQARGYNYAQQDQYKNSSKEDSFIH